MVIMVENRLDHLVVLIYSLSSSSFLPIIIILANLANKKHFLFHRHSQPENKFFINHTLLIVKACTQLSADIPLDTIAGHFIVYQYQPKHRSHCHRPFYFPSEHPPSEGIQISLNIDCSGLSLLIDTCWYDLPAETVCELNISNHSG